MVSTKVVVLSALTVGALAAGTAFYIRRRRRTGAKKDKTKRKKKVKKPEMKFPDNDTFAEELMRSMEVLQSTADLSRPQEKKLMEWCSNIDMKLYSTRTRLLAAQWVIVHNTINSLVNGAEADQGELIKAMQAGMSLAWRLLECQATTQEEQQAIDILMLDVAQRMRNPAKLVPVYERVLRRADRMSMEESLVMFTTAPLLGRWKDTKTLGDNVEAKNKSIEEFHLAAISRPELPDYEVLYRIACADEERFDDSPVDDLAWCTYILKEFRIRLRDVECRNADKEQSVRESLSKEWTQVPMSPDSRLFRHGGIGQMLSTSEVKLSMVGPWCGDRIHLEGYSDMKSDEGESVRQKEVYDVVLDADTDRYKGFYKLIQRQVNSEQDDPITVTFDLELCLSEDENFL